MSRNGYLAYRWLERGKGEAVLLFHGLMGQIDHWETSIKALGGVCRAIALELPIFYPALPEASIPELRRHVLSFMDTMEIPRAVVGGNSLGGHVALDLTLMHPERVSGLILAGSSGLFERGYTRGVPHRPSAEYVREKMQEVFYDPGFVTPTWIEEIRRLLIAPSSAMRVLRFAQASKRQSLEEHLPHIRVPTLLAWGKDDRITPPEVAEQFHTLIPDSRLIFLPNCGHVPMLEQPEAFHAAVKAWLEETRPRRLRAEVPAGAVR